MPTSKPPSAAAKASVPPAKASLKRPADQTKSNDKSSYKTKTAVKKVANSSSPSVAKLSLSSAKQAQAISSVSAVQMDAERSISTTNATTKMVSARVTGAQAAKRATGVKTKVGTKIPAVKGSALANTTATANKKRTVPEGGHEEGGPKRKKQLKVVKQEEDELGLHGLIDASVPADHILMSKITVGQFRSLVASIMSEAMEPREG